MADSEAPENKRKIVDMLSDIYNDVAKLYEVGYRCRYNSSCLSVMPLQDDEEPNAEDYCIKCSFKDRKTDLYCRNMIRQWNVLMMLPEDELEKIKADFESKI